ncbi:uncharacterized protein EI97DRAFT_446449 [Westerdykella ornata]|uniref:Uncharacterized protein n=1 Tax=Westerdykella ornata TaxID=318751 RepID=A0A6A6J600_WESOR|nr:uncharacterized protein EI97DRAFT_446449 [Westerdykella ornata]KAF2271617.1 hypothetical protein EI97DRAFT_446449 [Westerdykella ornata]
MNSKEIVQGNKRKSTDDGVTAMSKKVKSVQHSEKHKRFANRYYTAYMGCASYDEFEGALPEEYWKSKDPGTFSKQDLDRLLCEGHIPKLHALKPLQVVTDTISFLEESTPTLDTKDASQLRGHVEILKAAPHEISVYRAVIKLTDPIIKGYHKHMRTRMDQLEVYSREYFQGRCPKLDTLGLLAKELAEEHEQFAEDVIARWEEITKREEVTGG